MRPIPSRRWSTSRTTIGRSALSRRVRSCVLIRLAVTSCFSVGDIRSKRFLYDRQTRCPVPSFVIGGGSDLPEFSVNPARYEPYKNFKFRVKWDGRYVAGVCRAGPLKRTVEVVEHREGGDPNTIHKGPGQVFFEPITLKRGVTHDLEFERWANKVWNFGAYLGSEVSLKDFRKDIVIELYNEAGQKVIAYNVYRCWVSEYVALPELDADDSEVAIERITLEHEGWERDYAVTEPEEPRFTEPCD